MSEAILVTGVPGVGKTTLALRVAEDVKARGYVVGGMITEEIRTQQVRTGFRILDLCTGTTGLLAHIDEKSGPKIGKYGVNLKDLEEVGVKAIVDSLSRPEVDLLVVDEIGPMEICSQKFRAAAKQAIVGNKPFLGTVQFNLWKRIPEILGLDAMPQIVEVTRGNRNRQAQMVSGRILRRLCKLKGSVGALE